MNAAAGLCVLVRTGVRCLWKGNERELETGSVSVCARESVCESV